MIRVKHAPSAAALGESAYTIGRGEKRRWETDVALKQHALYLQARGQDIGAERSAAELALRREGMDIGAERSAAELALQREQLGLKDIQFQEELELRKEQDLAGREFAERQWAEEPARQLQKGLQEQERLRKNVTWQYDEGQKRELAKVTTGVAWLREQVASGKWTAEQAELAEQQLWKKYHSIVPLPAYDDEPTPQERFSGGLVKHPTNGTEYWLDDKGNPQLLGMSQNDRGKLLTNITAAMHTQDEKGNDTTDYDKVLLEYNKAKLLFTKEDELVARVEEIQRRLAEQPPSEPSIEEQAQMQGDIASLPDTFEKHIKKQSQTGRKIKGEIIRDKIYGEEAYNKLLLTAIELYSDIPQEVVKEELDKWWLAKYEEEKGDRWQKFGNPMEFEGAAPETGRVKMKAPDGKVYDVDRSEAEEAEKHGWVMF